jgi:response regulator RpfG family c-di-GMP phosphodiesterase
MNRRVLFVDDEPAILQGIRHNLRKQFDVYTESDARKAIELIRCSEPFAVVVSDMRMPEMDGIEFLYNVRKIAPATVRLMLTGNADQTTAIRAVNKGDVFKFLNKPCDAEVLRKVVELSVNQYALVVSEKELLHQTLSGSIRALAELLSISNPLAFGRIDRLRELCRAVAQGLGGVDGWELDTTVLLSQTGCVGISPEILQKVSTGVALSDGEREEFERHPDLGAELLRHIPRLEKVAAGIRYQHKSYDGKGFPQDGVCGAELPIAARILHAVLAFDSLRSSGRSDSAIIAELRSRATEFDPDVLNAISTSANAAGGSRPFHAAVPQLTDDMLIEQDVETENGMLLVCRGQAVCASVRRHLNKFYEQGQIPERILVSVAAAPEDRELEPAAETSSRVA